ncbi:hypothetical protein G6F56_005572 [Rhizopus delemar]|uniref:Kaptin n=1 Tax=Rhizopus stolonifer TaxID=4846 RepID=A0A367J5U2_RHIST|nr:hypothetical protein G6F56_005572 [Rhizopus delemar]RCH85265.1 hypothetical protein CU098_006096 [Rhizopus stolonifer]
MSFNDLAATDDNSLFDETHYARHGYERTNIYGLVAFDSRLLTYIDRPEEFPSTRFDKLPEPPATDYSHLLSLPVRHFIAASSSELTAFISRDGYWNCLNISLGLEAGRSEVIAIDAVEETNEDEIKVLLALASAYSWKHAKHKAIFRTSLVRYRPIKPDYTAHGCANANNTCGVRFCAVVNHTKLTKHPLSDVTHLYVQDSQKGVFVELSSSIFFPMMAIMFILNRSVLFMHIFNQPNNKKVICAGGQHGEIFLGFYDKDGKETKTNSVRVFSPITSVLIFQPKTYSQSDELHLVVTCAIEQAIVYRSIEINGLTTSRALPLSGNFDSVLCSHVMDVDWDGEKEILIGTYGRQVLIYKQVAGTQIYNILWKRQFAYPIYRIVHLDLNRDGLDELIVTTMYGVHIFQPNSKKSRDRLLEVLQYVESSKKRKYELLIEWRHRKELEKSIVFER